MKKYPFLALRPEYGAFHFVAPFLWQFGASNLKNTSSAWHSESWFWEDGRI
jgi:hypothetical protein